MQTPIREIDSIQFGVFSAQEILSMSVCSIKSKKLSGEDSVYDARMGSMEKKKNV